MQQLIDRLKAKRDALDEVIRELEAGRRGLAQPWMLSYPSTAGTSSSGYVSASFGPWDIEVQQ